MNAKHHLVPTRVEKTADILEPLAISPEVLYDLNELPLRGLRNALISVARQDGANFSPEILADGIEEIKSREGWSHVSISLPAHVDLELESNGFVRTTRLFVGPGASTLARFLEDVLTVMARLKLKRVPGPRQYVVGDEGSPHCGDPSLRGDLSWPGAALIPPLLQVVLSLLMHVLFNQPSRSSSAVARPPSLASPPRILRDFSLFLHHRPVARDPNTPSRVRRWRSATGDMQPPIWT
ncbi:hypothetical protein PAPYR_2948 [Paratrimastix pyriformis]|uniref:Uncharacterized protein n=1 Tax=Paratrimastix pyriformis TaxID=342808 RepID=A0ABQ8UQE7_9EUKA|nr:hypothetical protein PAPYR_2948 [Paratrimastix pyriformis]